MPFTLDPPARDKDSDPLWSTLRVVSSTQATLTAASPGSAGLDLPALNAGVIGARGSGLVHTPFCVAIPEGHVGLVCPRSGLALRYGITVLNAPGIIDSDYRGIIGVILANFSDAPFKFEAGDRIAQLVIVPLSLSLSGIRIEHVESIEGTGRGSRGFGSTGIGSNIEREPRL